jgi:hypothetical protein
VPVDDGQMPAAAAAAHNTGYLRVLPEREADYIRILATNK